jgi:hypothetical protein
MSIKDVHKKLYSIFTPKKYTFEPKQVYISKSLAHLNRIKEVYNLTSYKNRNDAALFFGVYREEDIRKIQIHKGDRYVLWGGTDSDIRYPNRLKTVKRVGKMNIIKHYAISNDIKNRLDKYNIKNESISFNLVDNNIFSYIYELGTKIFIYNGIKKGNENLYGKTIYMSIVNKLPDYEYIYSNELNLPYNKMSSVYRKCFVGLRLTTEDGNANMLQEMCSMGIPVFHNSSYPNAIRWKTADDIIKKILEYDNKTIDDINKKCLIIFNKDLNIIDGSFRWLMNFKKLLGEKDFTVDILDKNRIGEIDLSDYMYTTNYEKIYYRPCKNDNMNIKCINNIELIIHDITTVPIDLMFNCKKIYVHTKLLQNELYIKYNIKNVDILPPLIENIDMMTSKNDKLTFIYSGTLKKDYMSFEMINVFNKLSKYYDFHFIIIYGKILITDNTYNRSLISLIKSLKHNPKFTILYNIKHNEILDYISKADFGIVYHSTNTDYKQQSTKLIEYLSKQCIPISYLTTMNTKYIKTDNLYFRSIEEFEKILMDIIGKKIVYDSTIINYDKLSEHLIDYNIKKFDTYILDQNDVLITSNKLDNYTDKIVISNNIGNRLYTDRFIHINIDDDRLIMEGTLIKEYVKDKKNMLKIKKEIQLTIYNRSLNGFIRDLDIYENYDIKDEIRIFNYELDNPLLQLWKCIKKNDKYIFDDSYGFLYFDMYLKKNKSYFVYFEVDIDTFGYIIMSCLINNNGELVDINRNLHHVSINNKSIMFTIKIIKDGKYTFRIRPSKREFDYIEFKINRLDIQELNTINSFTDKAYIINLNKCKEKFYNLENLFNVNFINVNRTEAVNGYDDKIVDMYNGYLKKPFTEFELRLGRKALASSGALGYLLSMRKIFIEAIKNNYEYIIVNDDDIGIIPDFISKFDNLIRRLPLFKILLLGSSQWNWKNIDIKNFYYIPNRISNGSFSAIYHKSTFDKLLNMIENYNSPFDCNPTKSVFIKGNSYVSYPNIAIAQLEESSIIKVTKSRSYDRFRWRKEDYIFPYNIKNEVEIVLKKENMRKHNKLFIIGIVTYNRIGYLRECVNSLKKTLDTEIDYILVIADGYSIDNTDLYLKELEFDDNISYYCIKNKNHFIYRQSNSILYFSERFEYDIGFILNDDLVFKKNGWDRLYYTILLKHKIEHLVFYDKKFKHSKFYVIKADTQSNCSANNCQGAMFTFTKNVVDKVGYFDENNFKIRGHSHIDYTLRCCRLGFNNMDKLWDVKGSNEYIELNNKHYISSFSKLPILLRELYKTDIYEIDRRERIIQNNNRKYIEHNFI